MKYRVEVIADSSGEWCGNGLTFDSQEAAEVYARELAGRWMAVRKWRVVPITQEKDPTCVLCDAGEEHEH